MKPAQRIIEQFEERRKKENLRFQGRRDFDNQMRRLCDQVCNEGAAVHLLHRITADNPRGELGEAPGVDDMYGDVVNPEVLIDKASMMHCLVEHAPSKQLKTKLGIEEEREVVFWFPWIHLDDGNHINPSRFRGISMGDFVIWDNTWYIAEDVHRDHYFGQTDWWFFCGAFCNRYHHDTMPIDAQGHYDYTDGD